MNGGRRAVVAGGALLVFSLLSASPLTAALPEALAPERLQWPDATPEQLQFMRRVYSLQMERSGRNRSPVGDLANRELARIEGEHRAPAAVARAARALLAAARKELARKRAQKDERALKVAGIGVLSAYRPPSHQLRNWQRSFPRYERETREARTALEGGAYGEQAATYLERHIARRLAAPGFSPHNRGIAIDFKTREADRLLEASTASESLQAWKDSWFFAWLTANAGRFGFRANPYIDEPWHWEYRP